MLKHIRYKEMNMTLIAPSILSADFGRLATEIQALEKAGADMIHFDVMDGHFVPNLTFGADVIKSVRSFSKLPFDVHLMVNNPQTMIERFAKAGADVLTVHAETCPHLEGVLNQIKACNIKAGVALNPSTPEDVLKYVLKQLDVVMVMSVNPGFGGQSFITSQIDKIARICEMVKGLPIKIEVDGGINPMTAAECIAAGADILVAGTAVFAGGEYKKNIQALR